MDLFRRPTSESAVQFRSAAPLKDGEYAHKSCSYSARSYYCQPKRKPPAPRPVPKPRPKPPIRLVPNSVLRPGLQYDLFFFKQGKKLPKSFGGRMPNLVGVQTGNLDQAFKKGDLKLDKDHIKDFSLQYNGILDVPKAGKYRFRGVSSDGSIVYIDNKPCVKNDGLHRMTGKSCIRSLEKGQHHFRVAFFKSSQSKTKDRPHLLVMFKSLDKKAPRSLRRNTFLSHKSFLKLRYVAPHGFKEEIFYMKVGSSVPDLNKAKASVQRFVPMVRYANTGRNFPGFTRGNDFAVRWSGALEISTGGMYRFEIKSDDGSKLFVNRGLLINNDGLHGMRGRSAQKKLGRGTLHLVCEYFEKGGHAGMLLMYFGPDTRQKMVFVGTKVAGHYPLHAHVGKTYTPKIVVKKKKPMFAKRKMPKFKFR